MCAFVFRTKSDCLRPAVCVSVCQWNLLMLYECKMARMMILCLFYLNFLVVSNALSAFSDVLDNAESCEQKCKNSYVKNIEDDSACQRGCRLYTITKFISSDEPKHTNDIEDNGMTPALTLCHKSCIEAYNSTSTLKTSCQTGCDKQEVISKEVEEKKMKEHEKEGSLHMHLMKPVMEVREVTSKVMGILRIIRSSITTYFMDDDNEMVAVEGPVKIMVQINNPKHNDQEYPGSVLGPHNSPFSSSNKKDSVVRVPLHNTAGGRSTSRQYFKPEIVNYIIMLGMLLAFAFFLYSTYSWCSARQSIKKMENKPNVLPSHILPVKLVRPEDLTKLTLMDEEEAPALPMKMKLPDNTAI